MKNTEDLSIFVYVTGEGVSRWDGVEYDLTQPVKVRLGVARHWENQGHTITITDAPEANIPPRDIVNPLEDETLGEPFKDLKRRRKPKGDVE